VSKLAVAAIYAAWSLVGVLTAEAAASLGLLAPIAPLLALALLAKDLVEELAVRRGFREPEWWRFFEHMPVAAAWGLAAWLLGSIHAALLLCADALLDLTQDLRFRPRRL